MSFPLGEPRTSAAGLVTETPSPNDAARFLPWACRELLMPFCIRVLEEQDKSFKVADARRKTKTHPATSAPPGPEAAPPAPAPTATSVEAHEEENEIPVTVTVDACEHLVEMQLSHVRLALPPQLMQIIAMCAPYHPLLSRLAVHACRLCPRTFYELNKLAASAGLSEVCLDGSPAPERRYGLLLEGARLRRLSLARCRLDDGDARELAACLAYPRPASRHLRVLELVSNAISDEGARAFGTALRSNRTLLHLNLAGNRLEDEGAVSLLRALLEFPLTTDELLASRRRRLERERALRAETQRYLRELTAQAERPPPADEPRGRRRPGAPAGARPARPTAAKLYECAEQMAREAVGECDDPFHLKETTTRDGVVYSRGNATLTALNLAYNNLSYESALQLERVLARQEAGWGGGGGGLVRVLLAGNPLPAACALYARVDALLEQALAARLQVPADLAGRRSQKMSR